MRAAWPLVRPHALRRRDKNVTGDGSNEMSVKAVAAELGVTYVTALNYVKRGLLQGRRKGGRWKIAQQEFDRFQQEGNYPRSVTAQKEAP